MKILLHLFLTLVCLVSSVVFAAEFDSAASKWETFTSKEARFTARFPETPKEMKGGDAQLRHWQFNVATPGRGYQVAVAELGEEALKVLKDREPDDVLKHWRTSFSPDKEEKIFNEGGTSSREGNYPGRMYVVEGKSGWTNERLYFSGNRIFWLRVMTRDKTAAHQRDVTDFFDAFTIDAYLEDVPSAAMAAVAKAAPGIKWKTVRQIHDARSKPEFVLETRDAKNHPLSIRVDPEGKETDVMTQISWEEVPKVVQEALRKKDLFLRWPRVDARGSTLKAESYSFYYPNGIVGPIVSADGTAVSQ